MSSRLARLAVSLCLLLGMVSHAAAQTIVVNRVDGTKVRFRLSDIASIDVNPTDDQPQADGEADGHGYVDLGLPSGTLWATMNIGANSPEEYGDYFAWGETSPKDVFKWDNYQWSNGTRFNKLIKYCTNSSYGYNGFVDDKTELEPEDDAATANWGSQWCMPSAEQLDEIISQCNWQWTTMNGVNGYRVSKNGKSIFFPAAGYYFGDTLYSTGNISYYWSRMVNASKSYQAYYLWFHSQGNLERNYGDRDTGFSVRAVRVTQK